MKNQTFIIPFNKPNTSCFLNHELNSNFYPEIRRKLSAFYSSKFKLFFRDLSINTPQVLNKVNSLKRIRGLTPLSIFVRYLTRHGKKSTSRKVILNSFFFLLKNTNSLHQVTHSNALLLFYSLTNLFQVSNNVGSFSTGVSYLNKLTNHDVSFTDMCNSSFKNLNLLFSFYIYKVDKHIYKNSRGKSGKFTFIWKYIPSYKRTLRIIYWLVREVKVAPGKNLQHRVNYVLSTFMNNPTNSLILKIKKFSLNYVYFNLRQSLLETYKTSTR